MTDPLGASASDAPPRVDTRSPVRKEESQWHDFRRFVSAVKCPSRRAMARLSQSKTASPRCEPDEQYHEQHCLRHMRYPDIPAAVGNLVVPQRSSD